MLTLARVNAELAFIADDIRLERGKGYFYFRGTNVRDYTQSVMVPRLNVLTLEQWLDEARSVVSGHSGRAGTGTT